MPPTNILEATGVSKTYHRAALALHALRDISFTVAPGALVAIVGPSGSGKSTLLNILAGLDRPTVGTVRIAGTQLGDLDAESATTFRRRHIGFVFQFFNLIPTMSARRNVALPLLADRQPTGEVTARADSALQAVGMTQRAEHRPSELSGGEQQRIAIARALVMRPPLVLADEPTGNLDSATGTQILSLLRRTVTEHGVSIVMVTHSDAAAAAADRVLVIHDGRLVDDRPQTPRFPDAPAVPA